MEDHNDIPPVMRSDEDSSGDEEERDARHQMAFINFLRLVGGGPAPGPYQTNEELVKSLCRRGQLKGEHVQHAMLLCARDQFVPREHIREALIDSPIRVEASGFNISAPHMHATALDEMDIQPGHSVLDVGCGCGLVAAAAAYLAGSTGQVVGADIRSDALKLSRNNIARLRSRSSEYATSACEVVLEDWNVFIPRPVHQGRYDRVHVGAACPADRLPELLRLLKPSGGLLMAPVDNDLRVIVKDAFGHVRQRTVASVRFSELDVPRDAEVLLTLHAEEAASARAVHIPPSTFAADMEGLMTTTAPANGAAKAAAPAKPAPALVWVSEQEKLHAAAPAGPCDDIQDAVCMDRGDAASGQQRSTGGGSSMVTSDEVEEGEEAEGEDWVHLLRPGSDRKRAKMQESAWRHLPQHMGPTLSPSTPSGKDTTPAAGASAAYTARKTSDITGNEPWASLAACLQLASTAHGMSPAAGRAAGPTDCRLQGDGYSLPAHKDVIRARCEHFRAMFSSGMRDATSAELRLPEGVPEQAAAVLMYYVYCDELPEATPVELLPQVVHLAAYVGCPRLAVLCEALLAAELTSAYAHAPSQYKHLLGHNTSSAANGNKVKAQGKASPRGSPLGASPLQGPHTPAAAAGGSTTGTTFGSHGRGSGGSFCTGTGTQGRGGSSSQVNTDVGNSSGSARSGGSGMSAAGAGSSCTGSGSQQKRVMAVRSLGTATANTTAAAAAAGDVPSCDVGGSRDSSGSGSAVTATPCKDSSGQATSAKSKDAAGHAHTPKEKVCNAAAEAAADDEVEEDGVWAAAVESAVPLLRLAHEHGLDQLQRVAINFIVDFYGPVHASSSYADLPRELADAVAGAAVARYDALRTALARMSLKEELPPPAASAAYMRA